MKNNLTFVALCFTILLNAQWMNDTSCSKKASLITNNAIEYAMNLEHMALEKANALMELMQEKNIGYLALVL